MIELTVKGDWDDAEAWLNHLLELDILNILVKYGEEGVAALANATPVRSGLTASSWTYEIEIGAESFSIVWYNTNVQNGSANIAILIQYGHGTGTGGYVAPTDYINPVVLPLFDRIADDIWKEVTAA